MITRATSGTQLALLPHDGRTRAVHTSEEHDVYAGRPRIGQPNHLRPGITGWLGNPHSLGAPCRMCSRPRYDVWHEGDDALRLFGVYFHARLTCDPDFSAAVLALRGKRLGCPGCATGEPCHARIIADWIEAQPAPNRSNS